MANNLLIVEGTGDKDFIQNFLNYEGLNIDLDVRIVTAPEVDSAIMHTTKQGVLNALDTVVKQLNDGRYERIGVLIDMDFRHSSSIPIKQLNIQQLATKLSQHGFVQTIQPSDAQGVFFANTDFDHPIGVWLMPDNENEGYLEHWIENSALKTAENHFHTAEQFIGSFDNTHFKPHILTKAKIYTWLAIQPKPSQDLSRFLSPKYNLLDKQSTSYQNFKHWLITTFT